MAPAFGCLGRGTARQGGVLDPVAAAVDGDENVEWWVLWAWATRRAEFIEGGNGLAKPPVGEIIAKATPNRYEHEPNYEIPG